MYKEIFSLLAENKSKEEIFYSYRELGNETDPVEIKRIISQFPDYKRFLAKKNRIKVASFIITLFHSISILSYLESNVSVFSLFVSLSFSALVLFVQYYFIFGINLFIYLSAFLITGIISTKVIILVTSHGTNSQLFFPILYLCLGLVCLNECRFLIKSLFR